MPCNSVNARYLLDWSGFVLPISENADICVQACVWAERVGRLAMHDSIYLASWLAYAHVRFGASARTEYAPHVWTDQVVLA
ncbi:MAG: hypothetical protein Kow0047_32650 [Anaerolineae bacterium]